MNRYWIPVLLFAAVSCTTPQQEEIAETYPNDQPKTVYYVDDPLAGEPYRSWMIEYYETGEKRMEGQLAPGEKRIGDWKSWYKDGKPWSVGYYEDGVRSGDATIWYPNGRKMMEGQYKAGEEEGEWSFWQKDGQLTRKVTFKNGEENGKSTEYHSTGKRSAQGDYANGERVGVWKYWNRKGGLEREINHDKGQ